MSNVLVIKAHPLDSAASRSLLILDTFLDHYRATHPEDIVTVLDLYDTSIPEIDKDVLTAWGDLASGKAFADLTDNQKTKIIRLNELNDEYIASDKVVIANALWNLNVPTRLKAWFDAINVAGKTFRYTENGPEPLVPGKKITHIQSNGGFYNGNDASSQYVRGVMEFLGASEINQIFIEGIDYQPERRDEILGNAHKIAQEIAEKF